MSLKEYYRGLLKKIDDYEKNEIREIREKYNFQRNRIYAECHHKFDDWHINIGTVLPDTNILGQYYERRKCKICGYTEKRLTKD